MYRVWPLGPFLLHACSVPSTICIPSLKAAALRLLLKHTMLACAARNGDACNRPSCRATYG